MGYFKDRRSDIFGGRTIYGSIYGILGILENHILNLSEKAEEIPDFIETLKIYNYDTLNNIKIQGIFSCIFLIVIV